MAKQTSFAHQKYVLEQFKSLLTGLEGEFRTLVDKYETGVRSLYEDEGLMEEIYEDYVSTYLSPLRTTLDDISRKLQEEDVPFIEKEIDFIDSRH